MNSKMLLAASAALAMAGSALAVTELQIDVNSLRAQAFFGNGSKGFGGVNHTGSIQLTSGSLSNLAGILIDGANQPIAAGLLMTFAGTINLNNGFVTGGSIALSLNNGDTFNTSIAGGAGQVQFQAGQGFSIDGLLTGAVFGGPNGTTFANVGIAPWFADQPLDGSFINFAFGPNVMGFDGDTDIDIFLPAEEDRPEIPAPLAGVMAGVGMLGLGARRRR
jgi:hypothetical protein